MRKKRRPLFYGTILILATVTAMGLYGYFTKGLSGRPNENSPAQGGSNQENAGQITSSLEGSGQNVSTPKNPGQATGTQPEGQEQESGKAGQDDPPAKETPETGADTASEAKPTEDTAPENTPSQKLETAIAQIESQYLNERRNMGERWAVTIQDLTHGTGAGTGGALQMKSASILKLFIMAAAFDRVYEPGTPDRRIDFPENYPGELDDLLYSMITVSDNDAANAIVSGLGNGNFEVGMWVVNQYCAENGYSQTSMGRKFLGNTALGDNYTSANDSTALVCAIAQGSCVSPDASARMLRYMKNQTRRGKIPAGIASYGPETANKTGELYGADLGFVEHDICIVWGGSMDYILCVFSENLTGGNEAARETISAISRDVYENLQ